MFSEVVLTAWLCLGTTCHKVTLYPPSLMACAATGQAAVTEYMRQEGYDGWLIAKLQCGFPNQVAKI